MQQYPKPIDIHAELEEIKRRMKHLEDFTSTIFKVIPEEQKTEWLKNLIARKRQEQGLPL